MVHPEWVTLNPQPLPPRVFGASSLSLTNSLSWVMLNPQPLPPGGNSRGLR